MESRNKFKSIIREYDDRRTLKFSSFIRNSHDAINNSTKECIKLIASPSADKTTLSSADISTTSCLCAIGPEGGFNQDEILQAQYQDFISIKMGPRILRLETAVISALTLCQSRWGDFN